ncbi:MAG: AI-2E family transporter [Bacteroidota bacterium]
MQFSRKYLWLIPLVIFLGIMFYFFLDIVGYIILAAIISLMGRPIMKLLQQVSIKGKKIPDALSAFLSLAAVYGIVALIFSLIIPAVGRQAANIAEIDIQAVAQNLEEPLERLEAFASKYQFQEKEDEITSYIEAQLTEFVGSIRFSSFLNTLGGIIGNIFVAMFAITFISYFFLKEARLFNSMIMALVPSEYESKVQNILETIKPLLTRYFIGVLFEVLLVGSGIAFGLSLLGVENAIFIGFFAGSLNIIPYVGPILGAILGLTLTLISSIGMDFTQEALPLMIKVAGVFLVVQAIDNLVFQPLIYSNSVKAHPLEIFLVILMAGNVVGISGMILAIPVYTIFRAIAKEFLSQFKIIRSITQDM